MDVALELGAITDKVTVEAAAPLVQSETAAVGAVVQNQTIIDMPLVDRRGSQLAKLNGFTVQNTTGSSPQFSMAGATATMPTGAWTVETTTTSYWVHPA